MYYVHLRCTKCHAETEAALISLEHWPTFRIDRELTCMHRFFEVRLTAEQVNGIASDDGVVAEKGS